MDKIHLGHHPESASEHWNRIGHKQARSMNTDWCQNPNNFWGAEDSYVSSGTGSGTANYKPPSKKEGSHTMWWDPNDPDYVG